MTTKRKMPADMRAALRKFHSLGFDQHWLVPSTQGAPKSGKAPTINGYNSKPRRLTLDELVASYRPGYGLGFCPGVHDHTVVLDMDGQDDETGRRCAGLVGKLKPNVRTGSGSHHWWFRCDGPVPNGQLIWKGPNEHEELRLISRLNVVLPPTLHGSGNRYELLHAKIQPIPAALLAALDVKPRTKAVKTSSRAANLYNDRLADAAKLLRRDGTLADNHGDGVPWDTYIQLMLALQNTFGEKARPLFLAWAAQANVFDERRSLKHWSSWAKSTAERRVSFASLVHFCTREAK